MNLFLIVGLFMVIYSVLYLKQSEFLNKFDIRKFIFKKDIINFDNKIRAYCSIVIGALFILVWIFT